MVSHRIPHRANSIGSASETCNLLSPPLNGWSFMSACYLCEATWTFSFGALEELTNMISSFGRANV